MKKLGTLCLSLSIAFVLIGCSDPSPVDVTHDGELTDDDEVVPQDDSVFDEYEFDADEGWSITVEMTSTSVDSYVWLIGPDNRSLAQNDDGGEGLNARLSHEAPARGTYRVRANSARGDERNRGAYQIRIIANPASSSDSEGEAE